VVKRIERQSGEQPILSWPVSLFSPTSSLGTYHFLLIFDKGSGQIVFSIIAIAQISILEIQVSNRDVDKVVEMIKQYVTNELITCTREFPF
jgi:hypothetical protein